MLKILMSIGHCQMLQAVIKSSFKFIITTIAVSALFANEELLFQYPNDVVVL